MHQRTVTFSFRPNHTCACAIGARRLRNNLPNNLLFASDGKFDSLCTKVLLEMGVPKEELEKKLKAELDTTHLEVIDMSDGCGAKYQVLIVSPKFDGVKPTIKRHRMVHGAIEEEMKSIHAIQLKTLSPEEWEKAQQS